MENGIVRQYSKGSIDENIFVVLKTYGLIKTNQRVKKSDGLFHEEDFTERIYRFLYWIEYNKLMPEGVSFEYIGYSKEEP